MKSTEIKHNVQTLIDNFSKDEFIYDLLVAYGISKTSVTRLKKGDYNLSKLDGEILYKKKIFFKVESTNKLLSSIDAISKEERILKHKPRFAILTDYKELVAKDLRLGKSLDIEIKELPNYFDFFLPLAGSEVYNASNNNEADRNASYKMASLYDLLIEENPNIYNSKESIHHLNIFLSRLLFCFFAEDTEIFEQDSIFTNTLAQHTAENGSDTHSFLNDLFDRLDSKSGKDYPDFLAKFPYVNGGLFGQKINSPKFTSKARKTLIELGELQWKDINPDIFGSMIQAVVIPDYRSDLGMHYTSVENIKKLIKPLFLDELYEAFENATTVNQLNKLINRMSKIKFFDPACGSGNFLIITYKEIRLLEIKILQKITDLEPNPTFKWTSVQLSQFYGIEIDDFAHEMAILSLWLAEHQMNRVFEEMLFDYGKSKPILPLKEAGQIQQGNATRRNWNEACPISEKDEVYVIGNPPYLGARLQDAEQKKDMRIVFHGKNGYNNMDYISCWLYKAKDYIKGFNAKCAFVTTNSICQGEQVALMWPSILSDDIEIDFAHQSFKWTNNAKGNAGVTVIIVGLRNVSNESKYLFNDNFRKTAKNINPYLLDGSNTIVIGRSKPLSKFPEISFGSMPNDKGYLLLDEDERNNLIKENSNASIYIKEFSGGAEFVRGIKKYCLWIEDSYLKEAYKIPQIAKRIDNVEIHRLNSKRKATNALAESPHLFGEIRHINSDSIIIPATSSERRDYIPIGFLNQDTIISNSAMAIYRAQPWLFAVVTSRMHMVWVRNVGGKLETRYRYSAKLCYNTFPFPDISTKQKENLNQYVFDILDERAKHPSKTMAQLYNPSTMPKGLLQAHQELDTAIEQCYRLQPFKNDTERLEYLFKQYEEMLQKDTLFGRQKKKRLNR
ncbi:DNA methyltransferase [Lutibacter sp. B1]|uniref:DNA methyltransferase n=1 Tax=Lutibacter sp. B1 TaxID=2725996 RepID=UPI0014569274|nr:DNA methyltransferase [Lutibacter sp. B1]NLP59278.1 class I SAM-dependent DNA methyltransferase [Lutibacter sp. B1]